MRIEKLLSRRYIWFSREPVLRDPRPRRKTWEEITSGNAPGGMFYFSEFKEQYDKYGADWIGKALYEDKTKMKSVTINLNIKINVWVLVIIAVAIGVGVWIV